MNDSTIIIFGVCRSLLENNNNNNYYYYYYKRASLACAARLADTLCPPEAPFGRLGSHWLIIREMTSLNTSVLLL